MTHIWATIGHDVSRFTVFVKYIRNQTVGVSSNQGDLQGVLAGKKKKNR